MGRILDGEEGTSPNRAFIDAVMSRRAGRVESFDSPLSAGKTMMAWTDAVMRSASIDDWVDVDI
jgi:hypothetical protein